MQLWPVATVVPQVPPLRAKSPLVEMARPLIDLPLFRLALMVTACAAEELPTLIEPKASAAGELPR